MTSAHPFSSSPLPVDGCITLIGMAGAGKSTVGRDLAATLRLGHVDTDRIVESYFGASLESIFRKLGREQFLKAEESIVAGLSAKHCVISTGGSVIYGPQAVAHLKELGPLVFLRTRLDTVERRIAKSSDRGLAIAPDQTFADLYAERQPLYAQAADFTIDTDERNPDAVTGAIIEWLTKE